MFLQRPFQSLLLIFVTALIYVTPLSVVAEEDTSALKARIDTLEKELAEIKALLKEQVQQSATKEEMQAVKEDVKKEVQAVKKDVEVAKSEQEEWKTYDSRVHLGGYGAAGFVSQDPENDRFFLTTFNPIFHYTYKDVMLLEAELEFEVGDDADTELALEYATIDWLMNDYMTLLAGKFLSPLGNFRQNMHPAWINKLPSAPAGFHDLAAPSADVGIELRGGIPLGNTMKSNYAVYASNGPTLELNDAGDEIEAINTEGGVSNADEDFVIGGRLGFLPIPNIEIGVSGAVGDVAVEDETNRDYDVIGVDGSARWKEFEFRGEYIRQNVDSLATSVAPNSLEWEAWYAQGSYKFSRLPNKYLSHLEAVARYSDFNSTHADQELEQWALGLNYLITPSSMVKFAYEFNKGLMAKGDDRFLFQLAYGF